MSTSGSSLARVALVLAVTLDRSEVLDPRAQRQSGSVSHAFAALANNVGETGGSTSIA